MYARLHYDKRRGEFKIIWHPSTEVIAKYSDWDIDQLEEIHFIAWLDEEQTKMWKLSYYLVWHEEAGEYDCEIEEAVYNGDLENKRIGLSAHQWASILFPLYQCRLKSSVSELQVIVSLKND